MTCYFPLKLWRTIKIMLDQDIVIPVAVQYAFSYQPGSLNDLSII